MISLKILKNSSSLRAVMPTSTSCKRRLSKSAALRHQSADRPQPLTILTEDELAMRDSVAKLASEQIAALVTKMDQLHEIDNLVVKSLFENGLMGMEVAEEYGGSGCSFLMTMLAVEEIAKVDASVSVLVDIHNTLIARLINKIASPEQKQKYLPRLATDTVGSFCLTEPSSGSDAFSLKTTARKEGDGYVINGTKMWISNSDIAGIYLVMANANPDKGYKGISCFVVERDNPGLTVAKKESKLGIKASGTCVLHFDNCKVKEDALLGEIGKGYRYAIDYLNEGRIGIGAQMLGVAQGCLNATIPYTLQRAQFKKPIFSFQAVNHEIARMCTEIECSRLLVYNASRLVETNRPFVKEAAMAKYFASESAGRITSKCIDLMGGVGFTTDFPQEKYFRDAKIGTIYEGTSNMMLNTIARWIENENK